MPSVALGGAANGADRGDECGNVLSIQAVCHKNNLNMGWTLRPHQHALQKAAVARNCLLKEMLESAGIGAAHSIFSLRDG